MKNGVTLLVRAALGRFGIVPVPAKVWLDLLVQKPNHRFDAINVIDLVCDGIKAAIGVDDRWFSIRRLDWEIVKEEPHVAIGIGQETDVPHQACAACGAIRPHADFPVYGGHVRRICSACYLAGGRARSRQSA